MRRRLTRCLVLLGATALVHASLNREAQAVATWFGAWDYVLRHDTDGRPQAAFARIPGENGSLLWLSCSRSGAGSDLSPATSFTVAISQKYYLGRSDPHGRSTVYWFDSGTPQVARWMYRDRHGQIPDRVQTNAFIDRLAKAENLVVQLSNYRLEAQRSEFRFNAVDTKGVADRFRKDCQDILGDHGSALSAAAE
ncbi:hypothetical protein ILT44_17490 [Microvirga sp. BT689]|uniref:hypothetical protein n=1 Tax=Microvirga arvi TaxID=2778731 RepID=UPI00194FF936|nr:hypothetical protein [Microvirga arvi]MBM6581996.1 hypothetical protein [Microvirga arvi]